MGRKKKIILIIISIILFNPYMKVKANETIVDEVIFMGKVVEILNGDSDNIKIKMQGFIKNCDVYPEEIIGIITEDTKFIKGNCEKDNTKKNNVECCDIVYVKFNNTMTTSIPPQSIIQEIQISTIKE